MKKKLLIIMLLTAFALILMTACGGSAEPAAEGDGSGENDVNETTAAAAPAEVQLLDYGYSVSEDNFMTCGYVIQNPSEDTAYEFPVVNVTAYDENGDVLATEEQTMNKIQPGETQAFTSLVDCNGTSPDKVEIDIDTGEAISPSADAIKSSDLEISGTNERTDDLDDTSITGKIKNNASKDTDSAAVTVLFKKEGKIVYGATSFVDNLGAGKEKAFEVTEYNVPEHDSFEVSALDWGF